MFIGLIGFFALNAQDLKTGLVLDMPLRGDTKDYSGNLNHGISEGAKPAMNRFGEKKKAYYFDGASLIRIADSRSLHFDNEMTISLWANIYNGKYRGMRLVDKVDAGGNDGFLFDTYSHSGEGLRACIASTCAKSANSYSLQEWHHMVMVFEKGNVQFYIDGKDAGRSYTRFDKIEENNLPLLLGMSQGEFSKGEYLTGKMSDVKIYNRALNLQEVELLRDDRILYFPKAPSGVVIPYDIIKGIKAETAELGLFSIEHKKMVMFKVNDETLSLYDTDRWTKLRTIVSPDIHTLFRLDQSYMVDDCMYIGLDRDGEVDGYLCLDLNTFEENTIDCDSAEKDCRDNNKSISFLQTDEPVEINGSIILQKENYLVTQISQEKLTYNNLLETSVEEKISFISMYPKSKLVKNVENAIFNKCRTVESLANLADKYPQYAKRAETRAFEGIKDSNSAWMYDEFLRRFPKGSYVKEVKKLRGKQRKINAIRAWGRDRELDALPKESKVQISIKDVIDE